MGCSLRASILLLTPKLEGTGDQSGWTPGEPHRLWTRLGSGSISSSIFPGNLSAGTAGKALQFWEIRNLTHEIVLISLAILRSRTPERAGPGACLAHSRTPPNECTLKEGGMKE